MDVLCFDLGSGGLRGARFNEKLEVLAMKEESWDIHRDAAGRATLSAYDIECAFHNVAGKLTKGSTPEAICISSFMHSFLVLSSCCAALTPVYTWLDSTGATGLKVVRDRIGDTFHEKTGCHYHPMFPVFKLAANPAGRGNRVASPKAWLGWELTANFLEDFGMASASGLLNAKSGDWDLDLLKIVGLELQDLPRVVRPESIVGKVGEEGSRFGLPNGVALVSGSGDGFLANIGSACTTHKRLAVTLGTSGVARQMVAEPALNPTAGTFCYRADSAAFLLGCASSNGGNVLDWARDEFGRSSITAQNQDIPIFLPWRNGERSLEWNPELREIWCERRPDHTPEQLRRAVTEGVLFNLAQYVEVIERESVRVAEEIVLSGNGFLEEGLTSLLASLLGRELLHPDDAGLATLRGAAVHAWRALGHDPEPALERTIDGAKRIESRTDAALQERFMKFKEYRAERRSVS